MPLFNVFVGMVLLDSPDMLTDDHDKASTVHLSLQSDNAVLAQVNRAQTGSTVTTGAWPMLRKANTNSSGVATIALTTDGTVGGTAAFGTVMEDGIQVTAIGVANYNVTGIVVAGDKKTMTVTLNQIKTVLSLLSYNATADAGVECRSTTWGK